MTEIETYLERYYTRYVNSKSGDKSVDMSKEYDKLCDYFSESGTLERQRLINYLVYLEGIATVITNRSMKIENVDSLFGYRFFIGVNNPVVQDLELIPFGIHYRGIYWLYNEWVKYRKKEWKKAQNFIDSNDYNEWFIDTYEHYGVPLQNEECALNRTDNFRTIVALHNELRNR